ncbi:MAG: hypothetical protein ISR93_09745, partial [SAR324 cluster bacterium]|nr:hypothetical protein [SAR324 cluster bacterium]
FNYLTDGYYEFCTITVKDYDGNISNTLAVTPFTVDTSSSNTDTTAPLLTEVTAVLDTTYGNPLYYTFSSTEAGNITYGGSCSSTTTTTAIIGNNYITFNTLVVGTYTGCTITVRDSAGNESTPLPVSTFSVL